MPDPAPEADVVDDESWVEMVRPIVERFDLAAAVGMDATHNPDGARAISHVMTAMATKLDWTRPEIERLRAEVAELRYQLNRETNPRRNQ